MADERSIYADATVLAVMAAFALALVALVVRLKAVQVDATAEYSYAKEQQSVRRVQTAGGRGRILDGRGRALADNRPSVAIVCDAAAFQHASWKKTAAAIEAAIASLSEALGKPSRLTTEEILRYVERDRSIPLVVWQDVGEDELARFCEHAFEHHGFSVETREERTYPYGPLAAQLIGYVGHARLADGGTGPKYNFYDRELYGRAGLEYQYDAFLRGFPGERDMVVDARSFAVRAWTVAEAKRGPDLTLALDVDIQRAAERELAGEKGACVVVDPRNGSVLAAASAPGYDLNGFVPVLPAERYRRYAGDPAKPLLNRAFAGQYAPGSTFKPITALAGLAVGYPAGTAYECTGAFTGGGVTLHCARRWGHGAETIRTGLRDSCNAFFCNLGLEAGTNELLRVARAFGLGAKTGIDYPAESAGVLPDDEWKRRMYDAPWRTADLVQMSIGQGMLLVTPLQMALVAGAIGTGYWVRPHLAADIPTERKRLPFSEKDLQVVREGMEMVVNAKGGSGRAGGEGVSVRVAGKTGTAEVGRGEKKRKNTWFIAYAPAENPRVAVAMVVENGISGGGTTAPKVAKVLQAARL